MERIPSLESSHYTDLMDILEAEHCLNDQRVPAYTVESLMGRSKEAPFSEGSSFSGNIRFGNTEVALTLAASPHFQLSVPKEKFLTKASSVFGQNAVLPEEMTSAQNIAPHMIAWWKLVGVDCGSPIDLPGLVSVSDDDRWACLRGIGTQVHRALSAMSDTEGQPIVYGSWGYTDPESRSRFGLSQGAPTLPDGHVHIAKANAKEQDISLRSMPIAQTIKYYQPWNRLINAQLGDSIANMLAEVSLRGNFQSIESVCFCDRLMRHGESHVSHQQGYEVTYSFPTTIEIALDHAAYLANNLEGLYQELRAQYADYHINSYSEEARYQAISRMQGVGVSFGFDEHSAEKLARFVARIVPTSRQLSAWLSDLEEYGDSSVCENLAGGSIRKELARRACYLERVIENDEPLGASLVGDTYRQDSICSKTLHTWPARSSAIYMFDDITLHEGVLVGKLIIFPAIMSASGAPERVLGAAIMRDVGGS